MPKEIPSLGELETRVLQLVWQHQPCTERQISDLIREQRSVGRTTVLKTMQRLEAKRLLKRTRGKGPVRFRAVLDEQRVLPELVARFVQRILGGSTDPLVAYLADSERLSPEDVKTLQNIARKIGNKPE